MALWDALVDDAAMFPPGNASAAEAVRGHLGYRKAWFAGILGPLVVPDTGLTEVARLVPEGAELAVSVLNTGGAGGLLALSRRRPAGVRVVAVESALRDLDDLAGNAARVLAAAEALGEEVAVFVELPYAPGWPAAAEAVEAAGRHGKIRTGGITPEHCPSPAQLAEQLSVLVEVDLPFKATAGLHHAWPGVGRSDRGEPLAQHGFGNLMVALAALVDGGSVEEAAELLRRTDRGWLAATLRGWDAGTAGRVRRRFRSFGCCGVTDPVEDLLELGLVQPS